LTADQYWLCPGSALFTIFAELTAEGLRNYQEVTNIIFQYIAMMRRQELQEWIVDERMQMSDINFRFKQKTPPMQTTRSLAALMQQPYDRKHLLSGPDVIRKFDAEQISRAMSFLRPDNFRLTIVSQDIPGGCDREERWYGTKHRVEKLPSDFLAGIAAAFRSEEQLKELYFPHENQYIPNQLDVEKSEVEHPAKEPKLIRYQDDVRVWWKRDDQFWGPEAMINVVFRTPIAGVMPREELISCILFELTFEPLTAALFDACLAGLHYMFVICNGCTVVNITGYNHKLPLLFEKIITSLCNTEITQDQFDIIRKRVLQDLRNRDYIEPYCQVEDISCVFKSQRYCEPEDLAREIGSVTPEGVRGSGVQMLSASQVEILVHGHVQKQEALRMADFVKQSLRAKKLTISQRPICQHLVWPTGCNFIYLKQLKDAENVNNCIEYSLYIGDHRDQDKRAKLLLISQMMEEPCFDQLRTKEKLGYTIFSGTSFVDAWAGYRILIQSEHDCLFLEKRLENFLHSFEEILEKMSQEGFEDYKMAVMNDLRVTLKSLSQENERFLDHIVKESYGFTEGMSPSRYYFTHCS
jgi:insulysin